MGLVLHGDGHVAEGDTVQLRGKYRAARARSPKKERTMGCVT